MEKNVWYVTPEVEVIEVEVEKGFAASDQVKFSAFGQEENWN